MIGDANHPTLICSNRDEYFLRPTARGQLFPIKDDDKEDNQDDRSLRYCPMDLEGGGSWLMFDRLINDDDDHRDTLRFAIVLNYHIWRDDESLLTTEKEFAHLLSRGNLVRDFIEGHLSSLEYATKIYQSREKYRPFNLILSDKFGSYYLSSSTAQDSPRQLLSGKLYGISNGYMDTTWEKVQSGLQSLMNVTSEEKLNLLFTSLKRREDVEVVTDLRQLNNNGPSQLHHLRDYLQQLITIMQDSQPLADPTFGMEYKALSRLAAIYSMPTLILKKDPPSNYEELVSCFQLPDPLLHPLDDSPPQSELFGTRTITLLIHWSVDYLKCRNVLSPTSQFVIVEDDMNHKQQESIQIIANVDV